jgi:hypothetical protein
MTTARQMKTQKADKHGHALQFDYVHVVHLLGELPQLTDKEIRRASFIAVNRRSCTKIKFRS